MAERKKYTTTRQYLAMVRRMIKGAGRRVGVADAEDLAILISLRATLDETIQEAVDGLRAHGWTWASLGEATGTSKEAAVQKWAHR